MSENEKPKTVDLFVHEGVMTQMNIAMGRYAREGGYSYHGDVQSIVEELRGMMGEMPDEKRREVQRFVDKMERM